MIGKEQESKSQDMVYVEEDMVEEEQDMVEDMIEEDQNMVEEEQEWNIAEQDMIEQSRPRKMVEQVFVGRKDKDRQVCLKKQVDWSIKVGLLKKGRLADKFKQVGC